MTMTFSLHDSIDPSAAYELIEQELGSWDHVGTNSDELHLLRDKLIVPCVDGLVERPRLNNLLEKSVEQFPATIICGRAGTGKTTIAGSFVKGHENVAWYTVESTDTSWGTFSKYLSASLTEITGEIPDESLDKGKSDEVLQTNISRFLVNHFSSLYSDASKSLLVLDDFHHIFDAPWFEDFFNLLLFSLPPNWHVLLLCRTKPPGPLWRLRSKQMLNVLDEKVIAFDVTETKNLFDSIGAKGVDAEAAQSQFFGRVSKLLQLAGDRYSIVPPTHSLIR